MSHCAINSSLGVWRVTARGCGESHDNLPTLVYAYSAQQVCVNREQKTNIDAG